MKTPSEILAMFVAKTDSREYLLKPWRLGGFVYASNGHWIARVPVEGIEAGDITDKHPKNVEAMFEAAPTEGFKALPKVRHPGLCNHCGGFGVGAIHKCASCNGTGEFEHESWTYTCQACDGEGETFHLNANGTDCCPYCEGHGVPAHAGWTKVRGVTFANRYLWLLRRLPGIQIAVGAPEKAARIRFDGGDGLLMPYRD